MAPPKVHRKRAKFTLRLPPGLAARASAQAKRAALPSLNAWLAVVVLAAVEKAEAQAEGPTVRRDPVRRLVRGGE
jgi:hypothetical protein